MKKGFTLIELLAVIAIIGILMAIAVPMVSKTLAEMKQNLFDAQIANIVDGTKSWTADNVTLMPILNNESITITLSQLKLGGYIDTDLENPLTNEAFPNDMQIQITRKNNEYTYLVKTETGGTIEAFNGDIPFAFMHGKGVKPINLNETYAEDGVYVKYNNNVVTDYTIIIKKEDVVVPSIDTSAYGNYTVTYNIPYNNKTTELVRSVVVADTEPPVITYPITPIINVTDVATFDSMLGVSATDNSGESITVQAAGNLSAIPGTYQITYTASDSSGNIKSNIRTIEVVAAQWTFRVEVTAGSLNFAFGAVNSNVDIEWGDGSNSTFNGTGYPTKTYATAGTYDITLTGNATKISFCGTTTSSCGIATPTKLKDILTVIPASFGLTDASYMFYGINAINFTAVNFFDEASRNITNMSYMFYNAKFFNHAIGNWDVSKVTTMLGMFMDAEDFNQPIGSWVTTSLINPSYMFMNAYAFNQNINNWNVSNVTTLNSTFMGATVFNQPLNNWNTAKVTTLFTTFWAALAFNQPLNSWNTANVTSMYGTFIYTSSFNQPLNSWNTAKVTDMAEMFDSATAFNQNLSSWCVSQFAVAPNEFSVGATSWVLAKPIWGTCP